MEKEIVLGAISGLVGMLGIYLLNKIFSGKNDDDEWKEGDKE